MGSHTAVSQARHETFARTFVASMREGSRRSADALEAMDDGADEPVGRGLDDGDAVEDVCSGRLLLSCATREVGPSM